MWQLPQHGRGRGETGSRAVMLEVADGAMGTVADVTDEIGWRKRMEVELEHLAEHDWLTGLYNRRRLVLELNQCLEHKAHPGVGAVLVLDVDNFKLVNNSRGHGAGDNALKFVAQGLASLTSETDVVARLGGDEFAIVLADVHRDDQVRAAEQRVRDAFIEPFLLGEISVSISASVGGVVWPADGDTVNELVKRADAAMYRDKANLRHAAQMHAYPRSPATLGSR
jgi:diguanylate cyclase